MRQLLMANGFEVFKVTEWRYSKTNDSAAQTFRDGPSAMQVRCFDCGTSWIARESLAQFQPGSFYRLPLSIQLTCKNKTCGQHSLIGNGNIPSDP